MDIDATKRVVWKRTIAIGEKHSQENGDRNSWSIFVKWKVTHLELQGHMLQRTQEQRPRRVVIVEISSNNY